MTFNTEKYGDVIYRLQSIQEKMTTVNMGESDYGQYRGT